MISAYLILLVSHQFIISHHIAGSLFPVPFSNLHSLICMQVGTLVVKGIQRSRFALACALSRVAQDSDCGDSRYPGQDVDVNNGMYVTRAYNHCCRELYIVINDCFYNITLLVIIIYYMHLSIHIYHNVFFFFYGAIYLYMFDSILFRRDVKLLWFWCVLQGSQLH